VKIVKDANPFETENARRHSSYAAYRDGELVLLLEEGKPVTEQAKFVHGQLRSLILDSRFSCLGARSAFNQGTYRCGMYPSMGLPEATAGLSRDLFAFVKEQAKMGGNFTTFIACFDGPYPADEEDFERLVWAQLQALHDVDVCEWDPTVNPDPHNPQFSFSFAGRAFFIVGLHPSSSRWIRRFAWPTLVFNAHYQFEHLRKTGKFESFQKAIRAKDIKLQNSINPNLANFGEASEALQYSGRPVEKDWECPFHSNNVGSKKP